MLTIFAETTTILSTEFVSHFKGDDLNVILSLVCDNAGVTCQSTETSVTISGHWDDVIQAHMYLDTHHHNQTIVGDSNVDKKVVNSAYTEKCVPPKISDGDSCNPVTVKQEQPEKEQECSAQINSEDKTCLADSIDSNVDVKLEWNAAAMDEDTDIDESYLESNPPESHLDSYKLLSEVKIFKEHKKVLKRTKIKQKTKTKKRKLQSCETDSTKVYKCDKCSYVGRSFKNFREHTIRAHSSRYSCDFCERKFGYQKHLRYHVNHTHLSTTYYCKICNRSFKHESSRSLHMKIHEENFVRPECDICNKHFINKYLLKAHINNEHLGKKKSFPCNVCQEVFPQKYSLLSHQTAVHGRPKSFACDVCGKAFNDNSNLKEHKHKHDEIPKYQCEICNKTFKQRASYSAHKKIHSDRKDYICSTCGKGFSQRPSLTRHERIHTGEKPYKCALCRSEFSDYSIIRRHMIHLHKREKNSKYWMGDVICSFKKNQRIPKALPVSDMLLDPSSDFTAKAGVVINNESVTQDKKLCCENDMVLHAN